MDFDFNVFLENFLKKLHIIKKDKVMHLDLSPSIYDTVMRAFMSFLLLSTDFILFVSSGNFNIFKNGFYSAEIFFILLIFALLITLVYVLFAKLRIIQDILVALSVFVFVYALYNQFAQFDHHGFLADWFSSSSDGFLGAHSEAVIALIFAAIAFCFYFRNKRSQILYATIAAFAIFIGIMLNKFMHQSQKDEFIVSFEDQKQIISADEDTGHKAIYLFFPEASSYKTIAKWKNLPEAQDTIDKMLAFYAKNRFEIFPNAYVEEDEQYLNLIASLNSQRKGNVTDNIMSTKMLYKYWKFFNLINEYIYLQRNDLVETYNNSGYKTTVYKSRIVDLCTKKHKINVNRCVEKIGIPTNIYGKNINFSEKTKLILAEWLESSKLFGNLSGLYKMFSVFSDVDKTPLVGINYSNLYVINATYTFDRLIEDITTDKGDQAYFVFVDLPADMYIYNEFCEIKPTSQWISLNDLPWIKSQNENLKKKAYLQQTQCLYGKLEDLMQRLKNAGLFNHTTVLIQGTSSFINNDYDAPFVDNFLNSKMVNMAYKEENSQYFKVNDSICNTSNIINHLLYGSKICDDLEGVNAHISIKHDIYNELNKYNLDEGYLQKAVADFNQWFEIWKARNSDSNLSYDEERKKEDDYNLKDNIVEDEFVDEFEGL